MGTRTPSRGQLRFALKSKVLYNTCAFSARR
jgi:hypothetical protein